MDAAEKLMRPMRKQALCDQIAGREYADGSEAVVAEFLAYIREHFPDSDD